MSSIPVGGGPGWDRWRRTLPAGVRDYLDFAEAASLSRNTVFDRGRLLRRVTCQAGDLGQLTTDQIAGWLAQNPAWSYQTRFNYFGHLMAYYVWAVDTGRVPVNPMGKMKRPKLPVAPPRPPAPRALVEELIATAPGPWGTSVLMARYAGLRCMEIVGLDRSDVSEDAIKVAGKGGRVDMVPCHPRIWSALRDLPPGRIVSRPDASPMTPQDMTGGFRAYMIRHYRESGLTSLHRVRHAYCDALRKAGADPRIIQTLMRHTNLNTTMRYLHVDEDERRTAVFSL